MSRLTTLGTHLAPNAGPGWIILIRLLVGLVVFFPEGLQKLLFPAILGQAASRKSAFPIPI